MQPCRSSWRRRRWSPERMCSLLVCLTSRAFLSEQTRHQPASSTFFLRTTQHRQQIGHQQPAKYFSLRTTQHQQPAKRSGRRSQGWSNRANWAAETERRRKRLPAHSRNFGSAEVRRLTGERPVPAPTEQSTLRALSDG